MNIYDSAPETLKHINKVHSIMSTIANELDKRGFIHDASKLSEPEKPLFDQETSLLPTLVYGSKEYLESVERLKPALEHHYANNSHHPEYYENGIFDMNLLDIVEMFADWSAACERTKDGNFEQSIENGVRKYEMSPQLAQIFRNTYQFMKGY